MADENHDLPNAGDAAVSARQPIAIVGMGCIFPNAHNLREFWRVIRRGEDGISDVPESHWRIKDYLDDDPKTPDMTYNARGGFLPETDFDPTEWAPLSGSRTNSGRASMLPPKSSAWAGTPSSMLLFATCGRASISGYPLKRGPLSQRMLLVKSGLVPPSPK